MSKEGDILNQLKKAPLPVVPNKFFSDFSTDLWRLIELEDESDGILDSLILKRFENDLNNSKIIDFKEIKSNSTVQVELPVKTSKTKQILLWAGAVAASLAIFFTWPETTTIDNNLAIENSSEEVLLAYLDEEDLVDYLIDFKTDQLDDLENEEELLYEELEDEIYNYINDIP